MKKRWFSFVLAVLTLSVAFCSCGEKDDDLDDLKLTGWEPFYEEEDPGNYFKTNEELIASGIAGVDEEFDYMPLIEADMFVMFFEDYCDPDNPLQLDEIMTNKPGAARPLKVALTSAEGVAAAQNCWLVPIVDSGKYYGFTWIDCRDGHPERSYSGGKVFASEFNKYTGEGKSFALFATGWDTGVFAIFEDDTCVNLSGGPIYTGSLTFDDINQGYNLVTPDSPNDVVWYYTGT